MNIPKAIKDYCKKCNKHTEHKLKPFKAGSASGLKWGTRQHKRKHDKGYGGKAEFKALIKKQTKKPTFIAECTVCKAKHYFLIPKRMKKVEQKE